ncbi:MAG TPA: sulfotransferase family 2 domain-containing protein, partial [Rhodothermales bacterium]|nr:sulfotransferase family 2 domain-containing protein [Rhodothermales bacterium]
AYKSKILSETDNHYRRIRDEIRIRNRYPVRNGQPAGRVAFRDFVRYAIGIRDRNRDSHWHSQARLLMLDVIDYRFIGRVEKFPEDFKKVLSRLGLPEGSMILDPSEVVNPTARIYHAAVFDRKLADQVYRAFKEDFEAFGYDRDSWMFDFD